ncbi:YdeI/OmpD-associated family protein [bacterium]|nr:YdeI/OmpD-associated family protein [bacterium]
MADLNRFEHIEVTAREQWRDWLATNHERDEAVWLVTFKKHCGERYVDYGATVEEALCYGWVDSHTRRVDKDRTKLLFSPRRSGSAWSSSNKERVERLIADGKMTPAGLAKIEDAKRDGSWTFMDDIEAGIAPEDLRAALDANPDASANWEKIRHSANKVILLWIKTAKTDKTRSKRIDETVAKAADGKLAAHPPGKDLIA